MILVFQIILGLSVVGILVLAFRKIPVLLNYPRHAFEKISLRQKLYNRWQEIKKMATESDFLHSSAMPQTEKFLRKVKVFVLKLDNFLAKIVGHLRKRAKEKEESDKNNNEEMPS